jgi:Ca2+-transporting ATPase
MENIFLFLAGAFLFTFVVGKLLEKIRIPWVFAALLLGVILAVSNPFSSITSSDTFVFLAQLGMYFLLFIIGLEVNIEGIKEKSGFILRSTFLIILLEAILGGLLIHFLFGYGWFISGLVALSFATVGEAVLVPILDEFKVINTRLGQALIGIGTIDNVIEIGIFILVSILIGTSGSGDIAVMIGSLVVLVILAVGLTKIRQISNRFYFAGVETMFFFVVFVFLLFIGIGYYAEAAPLAALLAGVSVKNFIPPQRFRAIDTEIKSMAYGFFVPVFFLWVGLEVDMGYIVAFPLSVIALVSVTKGAKILGSYITARRELGVKQSILLGVGLSVRFSTSIVIVKMLLANNMIDIHLYSIIIASSIAFKFIVPLLFSNLLVRWGAEPNF